MKKEFLYLDGECVRHCLTPELVLQTVKDLWKNWKTGQLTEGDHSFLPARKGTDNLFLHVPACLSDRGILGFKWIGCYRNPALGFPFSHSNLIVLNDIKTGEIKAVVHGTDITAMRTAGGHAVAAVRYLMNRPLKVLSVIGNGTEAFRGIEGFLCEFPEIRKIQVYCRRRDGFEELLSRLKNGLYGDLFREKGRDLLFFVSNKKQIGKGADAILVATNSPNVLLDLEMVEPGTTVAAIDGFVDVDPRLATAADKWLIGNEKSDRAEIIDSGDMSHGIDLHYSDVYGEIADVVSGKIPGRESDDEIIVYTHMGSGVYDVACAYEVYKKAVEKGLGVWLSL